MSDETPSRREADLALQDLVAGVAELQGGQSEVIKRVDRLDFAVFGIPETDEKGLLGEMRELNAKLSDLNRSVVLAALAFVGTGCGVMITLVTSG